MRNLKSILFIAILAFVAVSCSDDNEPVVLPVEAKTITNLHAPQTTDYTVNPPVTNGEFVKFSFKNGSQVTGDNWDIAFRGTVILVNGGALIGGLTEEPARTGNASLAIVSDVFADVISAPTENQFNQDAVSSYALPHGSGNGWYTYAGPPTHAINPIAGKVFVIKTIEGNYAKMEIKNYYKDGVLGQDTSRYYTFDYVYNPNVGDKDFQ
ncbi:MAG: HmuY family protein [Polaribacter sp.]|uniref:HmuY family protein n=1 Tax=Algibacter sp. TaxID=1872428 RepID=UPI002612B8EB|nr:HmuY family protein [Algibacter sp.]MDG1730960.1 HmuY family protein [Algibacter sp.]MDG2356747.1 HmuY family protein [Polaribacter sp.]